MVSEDRPQAYERQAGEMEAMPMPLHGKRGNQQPMHVGHAEKQRVSQALRALVGKERGASWAAVLAPDVSLLG